MLLVLHPDRASFYAVLPSLAASIVLCVVHRGYQSSLSVACYGSWCEGLQEPNLEGRVIRDVRTQVF